MVSSAGDRVLVQWAADSAYRFYPLVGRLEARDWVDVLGAHGSIQSFGLLAWAACGKDPGFGPLAILEQAARSARYSAEEIAGLEFDGPAPSAAGLSQQWHAAFDEARQIIATLPAEFAGRCVTGPDGALWRGDVDALRVAVQNGELQFRTGSLRGVLPSVSTPPG